MLLVTVRCCNVRQRRLEFIVTGDAHTQRLGRLMLQQPTFARAHVAADFATLATVML